jgi:hypothetical protein
MINKYKGLVFALVLLRILAVIVVFGGVGLCVWSVVQGERSELSRISAILGIGGSLVLGIVLYSFGELISLVLDMWADIGDKIKGKVN